MSEFAKPHILKVKPYEPGKPIEHVRREYGLTDIIKMASNENPFGPSPKALEAMTQAVKEVHRYPDGGCLALKDALSQKIGLPPEYFFIGNGSDELIQLAGLAYVSPGEEVLMGHPTFARYYTVAEMNEAKCVAVPFDADMKHDLPAMKAKVNDKTKLIFIANPCNPVGTMITEAEQNRFLEGLPKSAITILDEAYYEYVDNPEYPQSLKLIEEKNIIIFRTFSKIYGLGGIRVGYAIARPELLKPLEHVREPFNVNSVAQAAAIAALSDDEYVVKVRSECVKSKRYIEKALGEIGLTTVPSETNFVLFDVKQDGRKVYETLLKLGVIIRPFGAPLANYLRVTFGTDSENERFVNALKSVLSNQA